MISVKAVSRANIDAWPLKEAGIPVRMLTGCSRLGYETIGKIRLLRDDRILSMRGVGVTTLQEWREYLDLIGRLERGDLQFGHIRDVFNRFLDEASRDVLIRRYGLLRQDGQLSKRYHTLQDIGDELNVTRERVRQVEECAQARLASRLVQSCLDTVYILFDAFLKKNSRVLESEDFAVWKDQEIWGGFAPACIMNLLGDVRPGAWCLYRGYLSSMLPSHLAAIEKSLLRILQAMGRPIRSRELSEQTADALARFEVADSSRLIEMILRHAPGVRRTSDGLFYSR
ncbi:MAG: sigma factor-like helix-turn-helix DNA-binding protein [Kiritimatiellia bacterium]|nr:sigma factor-like helix-turn-helix DNA-binding protein [Kiritimatiellia bacterium]